MASHSYIAPFLHIIFHTHPAFEGQKDYEILIEAAFGNSLIIRKIFLSFHISFDSIHQTDHLQGQPPILPKLFCSAHRTDDSVLN